MPVFGETPFRGRGRRSLCVWRTSTLHETEFEAPGLYAVTAPSLENALPRCAFPEKVACPNPQSGHEAWKTFKNQFPFIADECVRR